MVTCPHWQWWEIFDLRQAAPIYLLILILKYLTWLADEQNNLEPLPAPRLKGIEKSQSSHIYLDVSVTDYFKCSY